MYITYRDELGYVRTEVYPDYKIIFDGGKVYFTDYKGRDFGIFVGDVLVIEQD